VAQSVGPEFKPQYQKKKKKAKRKISSDFVVLNFIQGRPIIENLSKAILVMSEFMNKKLLLNDLMLSNS
jgi:hypothetical protein